MAATNEILEENKRLFQKIKKQVPHICNSFESFREARYLKFTGCCWILDRQTEVEKIYWMFEGDLHRFDGPAVLTEHGHTLYSIDHVEYSYENYCKHPMVIQTTMKIILQL